MSKVYLHLHPHCCWTLESFVSWKEEEGGGNETDPNLRRQIQSCPETVAS